MNFLNFKPFIHGNLDLYKNDSPSSFPVQFYFEKIFQCGTKIFDCDDVFDFSILKFLEENASLIKYNANGKIKTEKDYEYVRGATFWFEYKDCILRLKVKNESDDEDWGVVENYKYTSKKFFNLAFYAPISLDHFPIEDFKRFVCEQEKNTISLFIKNSYGELTFDPLPVKIPENINLALNYGDDFLNIYEKIKDRLISSNSGLYMFHGPAGTGKSTFIKYLAGEIPKEFIYIPNAMLETFTSDPSCLKMLLQKPNSILVLEDAEKLMGKRHGDGFDNTAVSSLLNMSDGILSDILNISIIATYNCKTDEIDSALKRKGRLQIDYKFDKLSIQNSKRLAKSLKLNEKLVEEPMTLAEIYNMEKDVNFIENENDLKKIGF
jgi:energy-coupling factor transporter ATP-binding protein EcfA2